LNHTRKSCIIALVAFALAAASVSNVRASYVVTGMYSENMAISVDCEAGKLSLSCTLYSYDYLLVHYPDVVNLNDTHLSNCTSVIAVFENVTSELMFNFNDTEASEARANADAMIPSMNSAFGLTFIHNSTTSVSLPYPYTSVIYVADGNLDMQAFLGTLKTQCVGPDVHGFSDALPTLFAHADGSRITLNAVNVSSYWVCSLTAEYDTAFPSGAGSQTINVLYYLGNASNPLKPSEYSKALGYYLYSSVQLSIDSNDTIYYVSCQPQNISMPIYNDGWFVSDPGPGTYVEANFYFGGNASAGSVLTFTFNGTVVPESLTLPALLLVTSAATILGLAGKRFRKPI
jgi:hypothetical protein